MTKILKRHKLLAGSNKTTLKELEILSLISKAKAIGITSSDVMNERPNTLRTSKHKETKTRANFTSSLAEVYRDYEEALRHNHSLDFDDLLLFGVKLFSRRDIVDWCKHVLVDEL